MSDVFFPKITSVIPSSVLSTLLQGTSGLEGASLLSLSIFIGLCMKILIGPHWPFFILCHPPISKSHQPTVHAQDFQILAEDQVNHIGCFHLSIPYEDSMMKKTCQTSNMEVLSLITRIFVYLLFSVHPLQQKNSSTACTAHNSIAPQHGSSKDPNCAAAPKDLPIGNHWRNHKGRPGDLHALRIFSWQVEFIIPNKHIFKIAAQSSGSDFCWM